MKHLIEIQPEQHIMYFDLIIKKQQEEIDKLKRGGHDFKKLYAAFKMAVETKGKPTVILAKQSPCITPVRR